MRSYLNLLGLVSATFLFSFGLPLPIKTILGSQPVLAQEVTPTQRKEEADELFQERIQQYKTSHFREVLQSWEQALSIYREISVCAALPQESR